MKTSIRYSALRAMLCASLAMQLGVSAQATVHCGGTVSDVGIGVGGAVNVQVSGSAGVAMNAICSVSTQGSFQVDTATCKSVYAALVAASISGVGIGIYYNDPSLTACSQITAWSTQPSFYFLEGP